ncbi:YolD-like family protein [Paenibacillus profundus]|uniref:YolD-like family protein n=1 Tax=Paenibacillus profundus TaxID=1173085 RepID=A0ABS8YB86_9BACL|nr:MULTISPECIES: YolD-like family protein [Paenibacillus]MCE5168479.1 YolD-like family protein [Paenibacillus profundus]
MAKKAVPKRPTRDEFELEELGNQLVEAKQENTEVALTVWGWDERVCGRVTELDSRTRLVHVMGGGEVTKIPFLDVMKVESVDRF